MAHSPAPWSVNASDIGIIGISRAIPDWPAGFHDKIADCLLIGQPDANRANAHLIAAAPELLAAAVNMVAQLGCGSDFTEWEAAKRQLRDAIAKAEGR